MTALLNVERVSVSLGGRLVVRDVSLDVAPGEVVGLVGANGSGKTSLLRAAVGLAKHQGRVRLAGAEVGALSSAARAARAGYLPQERVVGWSLPVWRLVALGAPLRPTSAARGEALEALERVGLSALADRGVLDLSGGERARVLLARLLATAAPLLVADEPVAGLDPEAQLSTMDVLRSHAVRGGGVLVTLHDLTLAARVCDRIAVLADGRLLATGEPRAVLIAATLEQAFQLRGSFVETDFGPMLASERLAMAGVQRVAGAE